MLETTYIREGTSVEMIMLEHVSSKLVEQLQKIEEEVRIEAERIVKVMEYFQSKFIARKDMEE